MLWPLTVVLVANTNGRLAIPALAGLLVYIDIIIVIIYNMQLRFKITQSNLEFFIAEVCLKPLSINTFWQ